MSEGISIYERFSRYQLDQNLHSGGLLLSGIVINRFMGCEMCIDLIGGNG